VAHDFFTEIADPQGLARVADALPRQAAIGRLGQVCDRWIYTACLCFALDTAEQGISGFRYDYWAYQAEYSRNLLFGSGAQMEDLSGRIIDRTRSRLDIPALRTLFGLKNGPHHNRAAGPPAQEIVVENSRYGLAWFRIRFGLLRCKACTKGEHVLRFEATVHNARELRCRRGIGNFPEIITRLAGITGRFATTLDCAGIAFIADGFLDDLPLPSRLGATRTGGIDLNKPRIRAALAAAPALTPAPHGFTVAEHAARVLAMTGQVGYTARQSAYDLRKFRAKNLITKPGRTRRYHVPRKPPAPSPPCSPSATRSSAPSWPESAALAWDASPPPGPAWTRVDRDYETLRTGMQTLFHDLGITPVAAAA
jgi:hypothetical protein